MSPVPGGRSMTRKSGSSQYTSVRNCSSALWSIGPRQMTGVSSSAKKPIEMHAHAVGLGRHEHRVDDDRQLLDPEHPRDREAPHVGVDHADALAPLGEGDRTGWW